MQEGDLADGPLPDILRLLAAARATGGVHVRRRDERGESADAVLFLREGRLYAATAPGPRPLLGVRLVAAGAVTREALEEALESQAGELAGWRLGELLVHLGYVDSEIVAEFVVEQILDTVAEVSAWVAGGWRFRRGEKTREADGLSLDIEDVLDRVVERRQSWNDLEEYAGGATAVPRRVEIDEALTAQQIPLAQALLGEVDGVRTLAELATRCGLTTYEAGYVLAQLVEVGAVRLAPRDELRAPGPSGPPVAKIVAAVVAHPPVVTAPAAADLVQAGEDEVGQDDVGFDAEDPLGVAALLATDLLDAGLLESELFGTGAEPADADVAVTADEPAPAVEPVEALQPEPEPDAADDDLAALFGGGDDGDLGTQLAVLARQAEEARWAAESRRRDEVRARRAGKPVPDSPAHESPAHESSDQTPDETEPAAYLPIGLIPLDDELVAPQPPDAEPVTAEDVTVLEVPAVEPYEPIGLAPVETYGLSLAEPEPEPAGPETAFAETEPAGPETAIVETEQSEQEEAVADEAPTEDAAEPATASLEARVPRLPTRSVTPSATPLEDDLPGALANLRGAIDLEALDAPDPVESAWPAMGDTEPAPSTPAPARAASGADRNELQSALSAFGDGASPYAELPDDDGSWQDLPPSAAWNPDEAHDFTPDDEEPTTDTAALLRELSFLGLEDMPAPPRGPTPPRTPAPRQAPVPAGKGKRKSIFGR